MVLELENISKQDFERRYKIEGDLNGSYQDTIDHLSWVLNSHKTENAKHLKEAIDMITKRFMPYVTTKYLRQFVGKSEASARIYYLLSKAGYTTEEVKNYFREQRCPIHKTTRIIEGPNGSVTEQITRMGQLSRYFVGQTLHKVITIEESTKIKERLQSQLNKNLLIKDINNAIKKYQLENETEITKRQEKAIEKIKQRQFDWNIHNCSMCNHQIKIPIYIDIKQELLFDIMNCVAKDIESGEYLCFSCSSKREKMLNENDRFDYSAILSQLEQLKNIVTKDNRCFSIPTLSFIMEFYKDIGTPSLEKVVRVLDKAKENLSLDCDFIIRLENIKIRFN